jgi:natural product biosynthesis luciferase-like monooxygenase protein
MSTGNKSLRCALIGSDSLLTRCGEVLERYGHQIVAVVSGAPAIRAWATAAPRAADVFPAPNDLLKVEPRPDYLFSITNFQILSPEVLGIAEHGAINFHDGPLPERAGLNTPVWALLEGAASHAVTWHLMSKEVDAGAVLARRDFPLTRDETAFTLNAKCYEEGLLAFEDLVPSLSATAPDSRPQAEGPRKYHGRADRPPAACAVDWSAGADAVLRMVRALDFGVYANPIGTARAPLNGTVVSILAAEQLPGSSSLPPGTLLHADPSGMVVSTGTSDLRITKWWTPEPGAAELVTPPSGCLSLPPPSDAVRLEALHRQSVRHEDWWTDRLATLDPIEFPLPHRPAGSADPACYRQRLPPVQSPMGNALPEAGPLLHFTALNVLLGRMAGKDAFDVSWSDDRLAGSVSGLESWFTSVVPVRFAPDWERGLQDALRSVESAVAEVRKRAPFALDLYVRRPELRPRQPVPSQVTCRITNDPLRGGLVPGALLTVVIRPADSGIDWWYDGSSLDGRAIESLSKSFQYLVASLLSDPERPIGLQPLVPSDEWELMQSRWNATGVPVPAEQCIHDLIAAQALRSPDATAIISGSRALSFGELESRSNQLAHFLRARGVEAGSLVGLSLGRSGEMLVALLGILKSGAAYVPLDPGYPEARLRAVADQAGLDLLLTETAHAARLPQHVARCCVDELTDAIGREPTSPVSGPACSSTDLAYVMFTSGSTGAPKGVMVEHRNVLNFFVGMDRHLQQEQPGVWLAVTSLSFDISVLELLWTLARGYTVVLNRGDQLGTTHRPAARRPVEFSLFYFASAEREADRYRLLLEGSRFADDHGFHAVWMPERHFHAFGGIYPNPAVTGAAVAAITNRVAIRAGSVVLPLHHPARVAEEWAVVDNLSGGRVGISFARGWQPRDFILRPEAQADAKQRMVRDIDVVRRLWRGEKVAFPGSDGAPVEISTLPRPIQPELPCWITSAGNPETFVMAGRLGVNLLTHLLGQSPDELAKGIASYRAAWAEAGHPGQGQVTVMLHSLVGPDESAVREAVRGPMIQYLKSSVSLLRSSAWAFPAFRRPAGASSADEVGFDHLSEEEMQALLDHAFERYYETSGLFGTPERCLEMVERLRLMGVDEIACLIDFGVPVETTLDHLTHLDALRAMATMPTDGEPEETLPELVERHRVTHLQCTPSLMAALLQTDAGRAAVARLECVLVGGEAVPRDLAAQLRALVPGKVFNVYGPTETTIWSTVHPITAEDRDVSIGRPIANTQVYVLDRRLQPLPLGSPGELLIGGAGVARGYLNRPDLTTERFVVDHFGPPGGRLYRTGDLARYLPDGSIEFLGRNDQQIKIRGHRIEPGEVEALLRAAPEIRDAVVVAREDQPGDRRLVAYVTPAQGADVDASRLRDRLAGEVPAFMVPSHFVVLPDLPHTPNGKLDRVALPAPAEAGTRPAAPLAPPSGELERSIAAIWQDVLGVQVVGAHDNFFELGGHSLLAVQAHRRLKESLNRPLSLTDLFRFPTVSALATYLARGESDEGLRKSLDRAGRRRAALATRRGAGGDAP